MSTISRESFIPSARIDLVEQGSRVRRHYHKCEIGTDLKLNPDLLAHYCLRDLDPRVDDMVLLAGIVAYADRVVARRTSLGWRRYLEITVPVHDPEFWAQSPVKEELI